MKRAGSPESECCAKEPPLARRSGEERAEKCEHCPRRLDGSGTLEPRRGSGEKRAAKTPSCAASPFPAGSANRSRSRSPACLARPVR